MHRGPVDDDAGALQDAGDAGPYDDEDAGDGLDAAVDASDSGNHMASCGADAAVSGKVSLALSGSVAPLDKVDLLFVIDDSGSMAQEQGKLAEQLPRLLRSLISGVREDGTTFTPVSDLHVGVVTTDLGTNGSKISLPPSCAGLGDDGKLVKSHAGCTATAPAGYLNYVPSQLSDAAALDQAIADFTCIANVGTAGCGFEQQLEAMFKAVSPATLPYDGGVGGHSDDVNAGFLRDDALLALIAISDEEDCSITPKGGVLFDQNTNDPDVKLPGSQLNLGLNIRCVYRSDPTAPKSQAEQAGFVYEVNRYFTYLKRVVKPNNPERIMFAAIVGIPEAVQDKSFPEMLAHPRMAFAVDPQTGGGDPTNANTVARDVCRRCKTKDEATCFAEPLTVLNASNVQVPNPEIITGAKPAIRFVEVAAGFAENGLVRSICAESYAPAINAIADKISRGLASTCLQRPFEVDSDGLVDCDLLEIMPKGVSGESACDGSRGRVFKGYRFLPGNDTRVVCSINQLGISPNHEMLANPATPVGVDPTVGWFYDTFSLRVQAQCATDKQRRVSFYPASAEPSGTTLRLDCRTLVTVDAGVVQCGEESGGGDGDGHAGDGDGNGSGDGDGSGSGDGDDEPGGGLF
ncbi:MAG: hypothetical protein QM778_16145 [Myxococcales bacterium]